MSLGEKIKALRIALGWSTGKLADEAGISRPYLWQLETGGKAHPSFEVLEKVARALGVGVSEFSDVRSEPVSPKGLPVALQAFVQAKGKSLGVTRADVEVLRGINFRGVQPRDSEAWELLFLFLKRWAR
jgi:transcriptional regulator with XRE-family HTH domain